MKRVYVAGAYSANNVIDILKNIGRGEEYSSKIFMMGMAPFCPWHDKNYVTHNWNEIFSVQQFYDYSIAWLEVSDAMFLVPGWENSKGTLAEIAIANRIGIKIFDNLSELQKWANE
jgi:hypothetical protein